MLKKIFSISAVIIFLVSITSTVNANDAKDWLNNEIDYILDVSNDGNITNTERFQYIENRVNRIFAGAGIAKFVAGKAWETADKDTKKNYIALFKRHLSMNIASMMQGFSNQSFSFVNVKEDEKNNVSLIDMEIINDKNKFIVSWRVKKSKDQYWIIDLLVADISLVITKRSEFNSILKKTNYNLKEFNNVFSRTNEISYNDLIKDSTTLSTEETKPLPLLSIQPFDKPEF